ncbi:MAG: hypothetical protein KGI83_01980 [Verrucomicrobiota bacterium]|nr:hypothetical protein [Verrucomicrobiota bacterium]
MTAPVGIASPLETIATEVKAFKQNRNLQAIPEIQRLFEQAQATMTPKDLDRLTELNTQFLALATPLLNEQLIKGITDRVTICDFDPDALLDADIEELKKCFAQAQKQSTTLSKEDQARLKQLQTKFDQFIKTRDWRSRTPPMAVPNLAQRPKKSDDLAWMSLCYNQAQYEIHQQSLLKLQKQKEELLATQHNYPLQTSMLNQLNQLKDQHARELQELEETYESSKTKLEKTHQDAANKLSNRKTIQADIRKIVVNETRKEQSQEGMAAIQRTQKEASEEIEQIQTDETTLLAQKATGLANLAAQQKKNIATLKEQQEQEIEQLNQKEKKLKRQRTELNERFSQYKTQCKQTQKKQAILAPNLSVLQEEDKAATPPLLSEAHYLVLRALSLNVANQQKQFATLWCPAMQEVQERIQWIPASVNVVKPRRVQWTLEPAIADDELQSTSSGDQPEDGVDTSATTSGTEKPNGVLKATAQTLFNFAQTVMRVTKAGVNLFV